MKEKLLKRLKKSNNKKGFTLIEIIVVLVILGIMAAIAVPAVMGYIDDAKQSKYISEARAIYTVVQTEEARYDAIDDTATEYSAIAAEAVEKTDFDKITISYPTGPISKQDYKAKTIIVTWTSDDGKEVTATIERNKEVKINEVKDAPSEPTA